jgi:cytidylate kinase
MKQTDKLDEALAAIRAGVYLQQQRADAEVRRARPQPFVTISRQAGAGGRTLARALADRLNAGDPSDGVWTVWDRELVEKISREQQIPVSLVESLEVGVRRRTAFHDFLASLSAAGSGDANLDEFQVFRRVARTARELARAGRAIIVGRGGVYATSDLPGGVHVRLVAPVEERVAHMARLLSCGEADASQKVARIDRYRESFHRRYWHDKALLAEIFTITLNSARMTDEQMVRCVLQLIPRTPAAPRRAALPAAEVGGAGLSRIHAGF